MIWIVFIIFCVYATLILEFAVASWRIPIFKSKSSVPKTSFTLVIPFRNEEDNLPRLLASLSHLEYPNELFQIILVNDGSTDSSLSIIKTFKQEHIYIDFHYTNNERGSASPKKDAIQTAISSAKHQWIVTTDADCTMTSAWLMQLDTFIQSRKPKMVVMPVAIAQIPGAKFLRAYEQLDFLSLMGATFGGFGLRLPFLCNGANLAYDKKAFYEVEGFSSNDHIASGDDHFLLEKFTSKFPKQVAYLRSRDAVVTTQPQESWQSFISQRTRWAAKSTGYSFWFTKLMGLLVFVVNAVTACLLLYILYYVMVHFESFKELFNKETPAFAKAEIATLILSILLIKLLADYILITAEAQFYKRKQFLIWYPLVMICYPIISTYIAIRALLGGFTWKERTYTR